MKKLFSILLSIAMTLSIVTGLNITASANGIYNIQVEGVCDYIKANEILNIVNQRRSENGLSSLSMDTEMLNVAMDRAMETGIYYSHTRPDGSSCFTISSKLNGENIAVNYQTSESVMNGWMNSSGHRANILSSNFKSIGIGCVKINSVYYWVQSFSNKSAADIPYKSGTVEKSNTISIQKSLVTLYARTIKNTSNSAYMKINETGYFKYGIINQGWTSAYCPGVASDYIFSSNNTSVVSIDSEGNFTAIGEGTATVSVHLKADSSKSYSEEVTVKSDKSLTNSSMNQVKTTKSSVSQAKTTTKSTTNQTKTSVNQTKTTKSTTNQIKTTKSTTQTRTTKSSVSQAKTTTKSSTNQTKTAVNQTKTTKSATNQIKTTKSATQTKTTKSTTNQIKTTEPSINLAKVTKLIVKAKGKKIIVKWNKVKNAAGYQVQVSTNKKFKKKKIIFNKLTKKTKLIIKGKKIKRGKTYYVRVRAYATYKDANRETQKVYGEWNNKPRKVKVKAK